MSVNTIPALTDRQQEVLRRIDQRVPIKVIAHDLGVSEARISQHIRALKDRFEVDSLPDLVRCYRACEGYEPLDETPYNKPLYNNSKLHDAPVLPDDGDRVDPGEIVFSDAHHVLIDVPWSGTREPVVVPAALDGPNAVLYRLAVMIGIAFGVIALVILVVTASLSLSTMMDGSAELRGTESERSMITI